MNSRLFGKTSSLKSFILSALAVGFHLIFAGRMIGQNFATLYSFIGDDDSSSYANLILSGSSLYGTTAGWGSYSGSVFTLNVNGTGYTNLIVFSPGAEDPTSPIYTNSNGARPIAGLILSGDTLYGTTEQGGISGNGTVFAIKTDGSGFTNLHFFAERSCCSFTNWDGALPRANLILSGNTLYGTTTDGGGSGKGAVFAINTDGTGFTNLHNFLGTPSEGSTPLAGLILLDNTLYGTTYFGGSSGNGTVFAVKTDGTGFTNLHDFTGGGDGAKPYAGLILSGGILYGTAQKGGSSGAGTVFAVSTDGTGFTNLHNFVGGSGGAWPSGSLILLGKTLYGVTSEGGSASWGTIFAVNTDGTGFTNLHSFIGSPDEGSNPYGGLILSGTTLLLGTTYGGGYAASGTVFSLSLASADAPQLMINLSGANVTLIWPTNISGLTLQSSSAFTGSYTNILGAASPYTIPITGPQRYFRLIAN